ncbi:MAG: DUF624 domain-containing protein [Suipraeoptans sp.]
MWKKFSNWYYGNNDNEKETPKGGLGRVWYVIVNYIGSLVFINIVFIISCLPIFTIPASIIAMSRYVGKIYNDGFGYGMDTYIKEFKSQILKSIPLGLLVGVLAFYGYYLVSLAGNFIGGSLSDILTGMGVAILLIGLTFGSYVFTLAAHVDLPNKHLIRNSAILMICEWKRSLGLAFIFAIVIIATLALAPYSIFALVLCLFSFLQLLMSAIVMPVIKKRIIIPYETT